MNLRRDRRHSCDPVGFVLQKGVDAFEGVGINELPVENLGHHVVSDRTQRLIARIIRLRHQYAIDGVNDAVGSVDVHVNELRAFHS